MNKGHKKARQKKEDIERERIEKMMQDFFIQLLPEINLRLFLDIGPMMWVDSITLTACQVPSGKKHFGQQELIHIWKRLTGALRKRGFLRNKEKRR